MSAEIFSFDIRGDKHLDKAIAIALLPEFGDKPVQLVAYREQNGALLFYNRECDDAIPFPAPIANPEEMILSWLKNRDWDTKGQYMDVIYQRGYRIYNNGDEYMYGFQFAVRPYWTEYHK